MFGGAKVAVTDFGPFIDTAQGPVPLHAPLKPANDQPGVGIAVRVTVESAANWPEQAAGQAMPAGALVTRRSR